MKKEGKIGMSAHFGHFVTVGIAESEILNLLNRCANRLSFASFINLKTLIELEHFLQELNRMKGPNEKGSRPLKIGDLNQTAQSDSVGVLIFEIAKPQLLSQSETKLVRSINSRLFPGKAITQETVTSVIYPGSELASPQDLRLLGFIHLTPIPFNEHLFFQSLVAGLRMKSGKFTISEKIVAIYKAIAKNEWLKTEEILSGFTFDNETEVEVLVLAALCKLHLGQINEAKLLLAQAKKSKSSLPQFYYTLCLYYIKLKDCKRATQAALQWQNSGGNTIYETSLESAPSTEHKNVIAIIKSNFNMSNLLNTTGVKSAKRGELEEAAVYYNTALKMLENRQKAYLIHFNLAAVYHRMGKIIKSAESAFTCAKEAPATFTNLVPLLNVVATELANLISTEKPQKEPDFADTKESKKETQNTGQNRVTQPNLNSPEPLKKKIQTTPIEYNFDIISSQQFDFSEVDDSLHPSTAKDSSLDPFFEGIGHTKLNPDDVSSIDTLPILDAESKSGHSPFMQGGLESDDAMAPLDEFPTTAEDLKFGNDDQTSPSQSKFVFRFKNEFIHFKKLRP